jgi:hypothetical protein
MKALIELHFQHVLRSTLSSTSKENGVRRGKFGGSILFAVEDIKQL